MRMRVSLSDKESGSSSLQDEISINSSNRTHKPIQDHIEMRCRFVPDLVVKLEHQERPQDANEHAQQKGAHAFLHEPQRDGAAVLPSEDENCCIESACNTCYYKPKFIIYSTKKQTRTKTLQNPSDKRTRRTKSTASLIGIRYYGRQLASSLILSQLSKTRINNDGSLRKSSLLSKLLSKLPLLSVLFILCSTSNLIEALDQHQTHGIPFSSRQPVWSQPSWFEMAPKPSWQNADLANRQTAAPYLSNLDLKQRQLQPLELIEDSHNVQTNQELQTLASGGELLLAVAAIVASNESGGSYVPVGTLPSLAINTRTYHQNEKQDNLFATSHGSGAPLKQSPINIKNSGSKSPMVVFGDQKPLSNDTISYHHFYHHYSRNDNNNHINNRPSTWLKQEARNSSRLKVTKMAATKTNDNERHEDVFVSSKRRSRGEHDDLAAAMSVSSQQVTPIAHASVGLRPPTSLQRQQHLDSGRPSNLPYVKQQHQTALPNDAISAHRMVELSFRQAPVVSVAFSDVSKPMQSGAAVVEQSSARVAAVSFQPTVSGESHWIPIVTNNNNSTASRRSNRISEPVNTLSAGSKPLAVTHGHGAVTQALPPVQTAANHASSTLLDFPQPQQTPPRPPPPPAALVSSANHRQPKARQSPPDSANQLPAASTAFTRNSALPHKPAASEGGGELGARNQRRPHEPQQVAGSHVHGQRHWHAPPNHYNSLRNHQNHRWRHQNSHHHRRPDDYGYRRRPRFNGNTHELISNSIEPEVLEFRPNKMYKRVLLCDKTLVSLDYIRNLEAEPRPNSGQFLSENEIAEIGDNLISDFEGTYEMLAARSSDAGSSSSQLPASSRQENITTSDTRLPSGQQPQSQLGKNDTTVRRTGGELLEGDDNKAAPITASSERRHHYHHHHQLLSDDDPLVRCDMWDLEKGLKSRKPPEAILRQATKADFDTVRDAINRCRQLSERTLPPDDEYRDGLEIMSTEDLISLFSIKRGLIPGTKWCGLGDQANSYNDLGPKHRIDICCRAHDHCPIRSKPFRNDYGVLNIGLYTKSHCDCDADFYRCLREVRSRTADMLGNLYFNVMKLQCMREERLRVCREMRPIALGFERCIRYEDSPVERVFKFTTPPVAY